MRFPRILIGIIGISSFFKFDISASVYRFIYDSIAVETLSFREILSIRVVRLISISHASPATILTRVERNRIQNRCPTAEHFKFYFIRELFLFSPTLSVNNSRRCNTFLMCVNRLQNKKPYHYWSVRYSVLFLTLN